MTPIRLLKLHRVSDLVGLQTTAIYGHVKRGLITPPIKLTQRSVAWPENEIAALNAARIAGKSDDEIRGLVKQLLTQRKTQVNPAEQAA